MTAESHLSYAVRSDRLELCRRQLIELKDEQVEGTKRLENVFGLLQAECEESTKRSRATVQVAGTKQLQAEHEEGTKRLQAEREEGTKRLAIVQVAGTKQL